MRVSDSDQVIDLGILGLENASILGRGGFGTVYRAEEPALHRSVAVKIMPPVQGDETDRIGRELQALGPLSGHPHIVMVHGTGTTSGGSPYIVMELMTRGSLADRLEQGGPIPWDEAVAIGVQIAGALETAHRAGILHRDLKPENILVSGLGEVKLADFGIARVEGTNQTRTAAVTTSVAFAAPEILAGDRPTPASDVYGLAAAVYTLIAGTSPFARDTDESMLPMLNRIAVEPAPDLRAHGVPPEVCTVIERALAKEAAGRQTTALEFARDLQAAQQALGIAQTQAMVAEETNTAASNKPTAPTVSPTPQTTPGATVIFPTTPGDDMAPVATDSAASGGSPLGGLPPGAPPSSGSARRVTKPVLLTLVAVAAVLAAVAGMMLITRGGESASDDRSGELITSQAPGVEGFYEVIDASSRIIVDVPDDWADVNLQPGPDGSPQLLASPDIDAFLNLDGSAPGLSISVYDGLTQDGVDTFLDGLVEALGEFGCASSQRLEYRDGVYSGLEYFYEDCFDVGDDTRLVLAGPPDEDYLFFLVLISPGDREDLPIRVVDTVLVRSP